MKQGTVKTTGSCAAALLLGCIAGGERGTELPTEIARTEFAIIEPRVYPDSVPDSVRALGPQCPIRLRDSRTGTEFLIASEEVMETDSLPRPDWPHEAEYIILLPNAAPGRATTFVRVDCHTLRPLRLVKRGA